MYFIVTTPVNRQYDGMWEIQWAVGECKIIKTKYKGLFLLEADREALEKIKDYKTTAIHKVIPLDAVVKAELPTIISHIVALADRNLKKGESFAVRCRRRGFPVSSKEIEREIGAKIVEVFKNPVNLDNPKNLILVEIIDKKAGIAVLEAPGIVKKEVIDL
jgi:tRNA acetyltransferase TAN1